MDFPCCQQRKFLTMAIRILGHPESILSNMRRQQDASDNSLERLSSGKQFTKRSPMPVEAYQSNILTNKMKELNVYKENINSGIGEVQKIDARLNVISNSLVRMQEIVAQSATSTITDRERRIKLVEYQSLYKEIQKQSDYLKVTGGSLFQQGEGDRNGLTVHIGPPVMKDGKNIAKMVILPGASENIQGLKTIFSSSSDDDPMTGPINVSPEDIKLPSFAEELTDEDGVEQDDFEDVLTDTFGGDDLFANFRHASDTVATYRTRLGAAMSRLEHAKDVIDVSQENMSATQSRIRDVDFASELSQLTKAKVLLFANTALLSHEQDENRRNILSLIQGTLRNS